MGRVKLYFPNCGITDFAIGNTAPFTIVSSLSLNSQTLDMELRLWSRGYGVAPSQAQNRDSFLPRLLHSRLLYRGKEAATP